MGRALTIMGCGGRETGVLPVLVREMNCAFLLAFRAPASLGHAVGHVWLLCEFHPTRIRGRRSGHITSIVYLIPGTPG